MDENFNSLRKDLTENDIENIAILVSKRCRVKTFRKILANLTYNVSQIPFYGILNRLYKQNNEWHYCAGQSYTDEIRTVRNIIINLK